MSKRYGFDIRGVIIRCPRNEDEDDPFLLQEPEDYLRAPAIVHAFDVLRLLVNQHGDDNVFLISRCFDERTEKKTRHWLDYHDFHTSTTVRRDQVYFCRERQGKADICKKFGITHFVDDRLEVLSHLTTVGTRYLFQPRPEEVRMFIQHLSKVKQVNSWHEILQLDLSR